jgi:MFS family permease
MSLTATDSPALGASIIIVGAVFQTFSTGGNQFLGSRLVIGFGAAFQGVASPAYVSEIAHPRNRPQAVALINTCW